MNEIDMARNFSALFLQRELESGKSLSREIIRATVEKVCTSNDFQLSDQERNSLTREHESNFQTVIGRESEMRGDDRDWEDWLRKRSARGDIDWQFWLRYKTHLGQGSFGTKVLARLDESTDRVLNFLGDPTRKGVWDRRGLVVGLVQSGKTAHYVGVMNKAVDSGYKVIVVLTGFNENLRFQTQIRAEEGFLGYSLLPDPVDRRKTVARKCGVELVSPISQKVDSVTTQKNDFKTAIAKNFGIHPGGNPILFVVKKNATVLKNLLSWVDNFASRADAEDQKYVPEIPLLVIDDESDVGSVNTREGAVDGYGEVDPDHDPSKINKQIRKLLSLFDQSSYVGYTATPFANVLIHDMVESGIDPADRLMIGEDLFPRSFIVSLPTPSNHVGPSVIFGHAGRGNQGPSELPVIRRIKDASIPVVGRPSKEDRAALLKCWMPESHKKTHVPSYEGRDEIPPSLRRAILSFMLVCCARELRGDVKKPNSMLVHVTRFVDVQGRVYDQILETVGLVRESLRNGVASASLLEEFRNLWEQDFLKATLRIRERDGDIFENPTHTWDEIKYRLRGVVESIDVRRIHGQSGEELNYDDYPDGLNVIAIGGDKLSRGLTLEGLSVSYFLRCSKMYDTLMQMGRWFGYRPGYLDLCRLYTTERLSGWFRQIADATEELRAEFDRMAMLNCTPKEFGLRVRSHPEMLVTSAVKMRHGVSRQVTFQEAIVETIDFSRKSERIRSNWEAGKQLIEATTESAIPVTDTPASQEWEKVKTDVVLDFLKSYQEHEYARKVKTQLIHEYVQKEREAGRLTGWRVLLAKGETIRPDFTAGSIKGKCVYRGWNVDGTSKEQLIAEDHYRIRRLVDPRHEGAGIPKNSEKYGEAMEITMADWKRDQEAGIRMRDAPKNPSGRAYREVRDETEGVLILYPLDYCDDKAEDNDKLPILAFAISFPSVQELTATRVTYIVSNVFQQQELDFE